ncbi:cilia- and flagella-associated protein 97 [Chiloscyllium plagiosum]|uniref:cilia- and flagella-associated protein 97 n=1 Tax=Chiloscyllium plagiosum TaxID=36176 RepID=UPI001CB85530|nr:cilia- and flagella-associated protein 97 [Chiloscyllium plagiosum]
MDSDTNLDEEVDHSFFDSDGERGHQAAESRRSSSSSRLDLSTRPPRSGKGPCPGGAAAAAATATTEEGWSRRRSGERGRSGGGATAVSAEQRRGSSASSAPASTSASPSPTSSSPLSSSSASRKGTSEAVPKTEGSPNSSADERKVGDEGKEDPEARPGSHRSLPGNQSSQVRTSEAADSDPDEGDSKSACSSSSSSGEQSVCLSASLRKSKLSSKTRKGHLKDSYQGKSQDEDAEGTVTDVTTPSSPDSSPVHTVRRSKHSKAKSRRKKSSMKQENISQEIYSSLDTLSIDRDDGQGGQKFRRPRQQKEAKNNSLSSKSDSLELKKFDQRHGQKILNDAADLNQLLKAMMHLERSELRKIVADFPKKKYKKNYTFSNEEARRIDRENHRLLQELTRKATKPTAVAVKAMVPSSIRVYHSTLNRQREQERIEQENLAFLKRLEAVKPTKELRRSNQLMDYQRQMSFVESSYSSQSRPPTRLSSRSSSRKNIHPVSNKNA